MTREIRPAWLLRQADELACKHRGGGRPRSADLRRSVSASYYALFHSIVGAASRHLLPLGSTEERHAVARSFDHGALLHACRWVASPMSAPSHAREIARGANAHGTLVGICGTFAEAQDARHRADYDHNATFDKQGALRQSERARIAIESLALLERERAAELHAFLALASLKTSVR